MKQKPNSIDSFIEIKNKETTAEEVSQNLYYFKRHKNNNNNNDTQNLHNGSASIETKEYEMKTATDENPNFLFCKSLVGLMDKLTPKQNMIARIKIQQILYEVKFDTTL